MSKSTTLVELIAVALKVRGGERLTARILAEAVVAENPSWAETKKVIAKILLSAKVAKLR